MQEEKNSGRVQKSKKNGVPCNAWTAALACLAAVFQFVALKNIPSLTGQ
jgi:hypothetical protein